MNNSDWGLYIITVIVAFIIAIGSFKKGKELKNLKNEAIKRGYAEMVLESPTSGEVVFKWKD